MSLVIFIPNSTQSANTARPLYFYGLSHYFVYSSKGLIICETHSIKRKKNGNPSTHPLHGPELRALRKLKRDYPDSPYLFVSERKGPMTTSKVRKLVARAGEEASFPFLVHPHMLRHACGFKLANDGHDTRAIQHYLGHKNIQYTVKYTDLAANRFKDFGDD